MKNLGKILILGHNGHGKDTAAEYLRDKHGIKFESSSMAAAVAILPVLNAAMGLLSDFTEHELAYHSALQAYHNRGLPKMRRLWKEAISLYNTPDKAALAKLILSRSDCYVGMRAQDEYAATKHLFDHILWIDAAPRVAADDCTMGIAFDSTIMWYITNANPVAGMHAQLDEFVTKMLDNKRL